MNNGVPFVSLEAGPLTGGRHFRLFAFSNRAVKKTKTEVSMAAVESRPVIWTDLLELVN